MIIGAVDVGSNSVKLLIAEHRRGELKTLAHRVVITRLSAGVKDGGAIKLENADRTLAALSDFKELCDGFNCDRVITVGTEVFRRAANARDFIERCEYEAGLRLRVIGGQEEARLSFLGATADWPGRPLAAIDIGGGSTEFVVGRDGKPSIAVSLPVGCVAITEAHLKADPPTGLQCEKAMRAVRKALPGLSARVREEMERSGDLVGVGGTSVTAGAILAARRGPRTRLHGMRATRTELETLLGDLGAMKLAQRRQVEGLEPERADVILAGLMILLEAMYALKVPRLLISRHGLRRGVILDAVRAPR